MVGRGVGRVGWVALGWGGGDVVWGVVWGGGRSLFGRFAQVVGNKSVGAFRPLQGPTRHDGIIPMLEK